jgi:hippurate hydrolase
MAAWIGTAELLSSLRRQWKGTLMLVAQPAEEVLTGARALLNDGLFSRFAKPDMAFAIHVHDQLPVGTIGYTYGPFAASADSVDMVVHGRGGHGAYPHTAIDPIVIAARTVVAIQTIVSRENDPTDPAVVTVGAIHGGTKHNVIPDDVELKLTVRTYRVETRNRILASIRRIANAEAAAAGAPEPPSIAIERGTSAAVNDPTRTRLALDALRTASRAWALRELPPEMGSEDFGEYANEGVPSVMLQVGVADPAKYVASRQGGAPLPSIHSGAFLPTRPDSLRIAILVESIAALDFLRTTKE